MRVLFLAMPGRLATSALTALLDARVELAALALPGPPGSAPLSRLPPMAGSSARLDLSVSALPPGLLQIAAAHSIPTFALRDMGNPVIYNALAELRPDLGVVACWPWKLPPQLLALPPLGFLNLHPSLLPALRGPEPLFWSLRGDTERGGVTLHQMNNELDAGEIVLQTSLDLPAGISWEEAEERAGKLGADLLGQALRNLERHNILPLRPQEGRTSYAPSPQPADFAIDPAWPARRAFAFMRGTAAWGQLYPLQIAGSDLLLSAALDYAHSASLGRPFSVEGEIARIQLNPGVLRARLAMGNTSTKW